MNVQQLIDALNKVEHKSLNVISEGCDCDGDVTVVEVIEPKRDKVERYSYEGRVYLRR